MKESTLKKLRTKMGLSQYALAKEAQMAQATISTLEAGYVKFSQRSLERLAKTLEVPESALAGKDGYAKI